MILSVENNLDKKSLYSFTSTSISSGGTAIPIKNINSFTASHAIQVGKTSEEQTEIVLLGTAAPSGTALALSGTARFDHPIDTPVFDINYNQIVFKRSITGTSGSATALATASITPDAQYTQYNDTSGAATYAYKTCYRNSVTGDETSDSDWFVPGGPTFYSLAKLRQRTKDALFSAGYIKSDDTIDDWLNECLEDMNNAAIKVNQGYALGTANVSFGTAGLGTVTESDFKQPQKFEVTYDGVNYVPAGEISINRSSDSDVFSAVYPSYFWSGDTTFRVKPAGSGGTARITYGEIYTKMDSDGDELPQTLRSYTICFIEWALWRAYGNDQKREYANDHFNVYNGKKAEFISEITPRDQSGEKYINLTDTLSGREDDTLIEELL